MPCTGFEPTEMFSWLQVLILLSYQGNHSGVIRILAQGQQKLPDICLTMPLAPRIFFCGQSRLQLYLYANTCN